MFDLNSRTNWGEKSWTLFTLDSNNTSKSSWAEQTTETNNMVKNPNCGEPAGYFTNVVEDLNSALLWTNPASGQGGIWTRGPQITGPAL